jgi:hypothetical protein
MGENRISMDFTGHADAYAHEFDRYSMSELQEMYYEYLADAIEEAKNPLKPTRN